MPISRKKSCAQCRTAKAGCNQALPACSSCIDRALPCDYGAGSLSLASPYRRVTFSGQSATTSYIAGATLDELHVDNVTDLTILDPRDTYLGDFGLVSDDDTLGLNDISADAVSNNGAIQWVDGEWTNLDLTKSPFFGPSSNPASLEEKTTDSVDYRTSCETAALGLPQKKSTGERTTSFDSFPSINQTTSQIKCDQTSNQYSFFGNATLSDSGEPANLVIPVCFAGLSPSRRATSPSDLLAIKVILGQILSYPRRLINSTQLPPFIHPPCYTNESSSLECSLNGSHKCLPKPLAICAGLVRMFETVMPGNRSYVWSTIYLEQTRIYREVTRYILHI
jgi:hypothetical protein